LEQVKASILIFKVDPILDKLEKCETAGAHSSATLSEQQRPPVPNAATAAPQFHRHHRPGRK
jgi:hypothetical protein